MAKRLGQVIAIAGWLIGALVAWSGYASQIPIPFIIVVAAIPVLIGHAALYVLAGR
jgi:hypothetical protein